MQSKEFAEILVEWDRDRWRGVARLKNRLTAPAVWPAVRRSLVGLVEDQRDLAARLDTIRPPGKSPAAPYLRQAVISALLHLRAPSRYCIWNGTSESALKYLGLWPDIPRGATFAERYLLINMTVRRCSRATGLSLAMLDRLWYDACQELTSCPFDDADDPAGLEGGSRAIQSRTKRDTTIIKKAKLRWSAGGLVSPVCVVCGWAMDEIYGDDGFGFIEAHHNDPLGNSTEQRVTRIEDLSPVCPNCHAILHRSGKTIKELKAVIKANGMTGF